MTQVSQRQVWLAYAMGITSGVLGGLIYSQTRDVHADPELAQFQEVTDFVAKTYVKPMDRDEVVERSLRGLTRSLDPYSRFYDAEESAHLEQETAGNYPGIGVVISRIDNRQRVLFCMPDSPAEKSGLRSGDEILTVGGVSSADLDSIAFSETMRGIEGSSVRLEVAHLSGERRELEVERALVLDPSVRHAEILPDTPGIGYISVHTFSRRTTDEFDRAMTLLETQNLRGLIIDLRGNLGGVMESAVRLADRFIDSGVIVRTESRKATEVREANSEQTRWNELPLVLLVNGDSASASEILAGALQDHRRAALVGTPTYGKGLVQTIRKFPKYGTRAKVTSAYYYSPSGRLFERTADESRSHGIMPDVWIELDEAQARNTAIYLASYGAPNESRAQLLAWSQAEDLDLVREVPQDLQLLAALDLLQGIRPSEQIAQSDPEEATK